MRRRIDDAVTGVTLLMAVTRNRFDMQGRRGRCRHVSPNPHRRSVKNESGSGQVNEQAAKTHEHILVNAIEAA